MERSGEVQVHSAKVRRSCRLPVVGCRGSTAHPRCVSLMRRGRAGAPRQPTTGNRQPILMRLLIVEDEDLLARRIADAFGDAGYAVDRASDGERADFLAHTESYDAIVLDLGLPKV